MRIVGIEKIEPLTRREFVQQVVDGVLAKYEVIANHLSVIGIATIEDDLAGMCISDDYQDCRVWLDKTYLNEESRFQVEWVIVHELFHVLLCYMMAHGYKPEYNYNDDVVEHDLSPYAACGIASEMFCEIGAAVYMEKTYWKPIVSNWIYAEYTKVMLLLADM